METKHQKLLKKFEEKKHRMEFIKEFQETTNKWQFLVDHPSVFGGSTGTAPIIPTPIVFLPNGTQTQSHTITSTPGVTATFTSGVSILNNFAPPYKISFTVGYTLTGNTLRPAFFIRDTNVVPSSQGTFLPDVSNGDIVLFGAYTTSPTGSLILNNITSGGTTTNYGGTATTFFSGSGLPLSTAIYTIIESPANSFKINVYDGAAFSSKAYFSFTSTFVGSIRNIALFDLYDGFGGASQTNTTFSMVPTVGW